MTTTACTTSRATFHGFLPTLNTAPVVVEFMSDGGFLLWNVVSDEAEEIWNAVIDHEGDYLSTFVFTTTGGTIELDGLGLDSLDTMARLALGLN